MDIALANKLTLTHAVCPKCGSDKIGNGAGSLIIDEHTFTRTCKCGWKIEVEAEAPSEPCTNCFLADWVDMYGTMVWACDMSHCIKAEEDM